MRNLIILSLITGLLLSCQNGDKNKTEAALITKNNPELASDIMTPEILWSFGRLSDVQVSPSGNKVLYGVTYYSIEQNKSNRELFVMNTDGSDKVQMTKTPKSEFNAVWHPASEKIVFLSPAPDDLQAWIMNPDGSGKKQLSDIKGGINTLAFAPSGDKLYYTKDVKIDRTREDIYPDLPKSDARIITDLMYRHWDTWEDGAYSHIFITDFDGRIIPEGKDIMPGEPYDTPLMPFGGPEEISWSPDGKSIAYTCKKLKGIDYTLSTNSDIYLYDLETGETKNLTGGMPGYDRAPLFSPDGKKLYWLSMERAGFEADKDRLFELNLETGEKRYLTEDFDHSPSGLVWADVGNTLYFVAGVMATFQIYKIDVTTKAIKAITSGTHDYHSVAPAGESLIATRVDMTKPQEIYRVNAETGIAEEISFENRHILDKLTMPKVEMRWITTTDNLEMPTWIIYPPHFDPERTYPALLYCEGGPQSPLSQFWSYRWNFSQMASNGYIIVAPNRRGVLTLGQHWTDQISKDNSGQAMRDLLRAIDVIKKEPFIDENRLGAIGASFGGYSVNWLAGNHEGRFKAFISHCGVFNAEMEYMTTDEMFFDNWEKGGAPWETDNTAAMKSYAGSPHKFVQNWNTPILIIHGEHDYRIPYTQGLAAFNSAQLLGVPSKLLFFPSETHWVLSPQNGILWQREFRSWLDHWLGEVRQE
ncbi:MAG TPA: S9 family peptidase [Bacteroidaceae bacterium]|nr:S9 family peptidase [Bacteroidaceae bacterium]